MMTATEPMFVIPIIVMVILVSGLRIVKQYQRVIVFRLGRYHSTRDPSLTWIIPGIDFLKLVDVRVVTLSIEPQESMTKDNVPVKVHAVVWYRVTRPKEALIEVESMSPLFRKLL
jgi:regulator of protease activity HflC (stomatin/prohibitin superfamily)